MEQPNFDRFSTERYSRLPPDRQARSIGLIKGHIQSVLEIAYNAEIGGARSDAAVFDNYAQRVVEDIDRLARDGIAGAQPIIEHLEGIKGIDGSLPNTVLTKGDLVSRMMMRMSSP
jgi:hypothetical protein